MKNKKTLYIFLLIIAILIAFIAVENFLKNKPVQFSIEEPIFSEADKYTKSLGYNTICDTEHAFYRLKDEVLEKKVDIIRRYETMFELAKREYGMEFKPPIMYISDNTNDIKRDFLGFTVSVDDPFSLGMAFCHASGGKLPAWICSGLENYWAEIYDFPITAKKISSNEITAAFKSDIVQKLPPFGDAWLIKNFNKSTDINVLHDYAYNFIYYLAKTNQLSNYIKLVSIDYRTFINKSQEMMDLFSKGMWRGNMSIFVHYNYGEDFSINTTEAIYKYEPHTWNWKDIVTWTEEMDAGIMFVKNYINFDYEDQLDITLNFAYNKYSWASSSNKIVLNNLKFGPEQCSHEVTHALCDLSGIEKSTSVFFKEGFASLMCSLFDNEYKTLRFKRYQKIISNTSDDDIKELAKIYEDRILKFNNGTEFDMHIFLDSQAILEFRTGERRPLIHSNNIDAKLGTFLTNEMYTYYKAESFLSYLYNSYGSERLINAYSDNTKIEELYGKSLEDLVNEWRNYLSIN